MSNVSMKKSFLDYKLYVFDLDGTLYFQKKLRLIMAIRLIKYYGLHFWQFRELLIIKKFRDVKDNWENIQKSLNINALNGESDIDEQQYKYVAMKLNTSPEKVKNVIHRWIYENPLDALKLSKDERLSGIIERELKDKKVVVLSDYPAYDKLKAMDINIKDAYCTAQKEIGELKPSPKGLMYISSLYDVPTSDMLMIGDRMEKDGECAKRAGVDYVIIGRQASKRKYDFI